MKVLVSGGAGFIGANIVNQLVADGIKTVVIDNLSNGQRHLVNESARFYELDIRDSNLEEVFFRERPDYVIHQAAQVNVQKSLENPAYDAEINLLGTVNILQCCAEFGVKKLIYASSAAVYGDPVYLPVDEHHPTQPISFYGASKYASELYIQIFARIHNLKYTILRYSNVYGGRQLQAEGGVISAFLDKLINGDSPIVFGDGSQTRDFIFVRDVVSANIAALSHGDNEIVNISCNAQHSLTEIVSMLNHCMQTEIASQFLPRNPGDILHSYLSNEKAQRNLGWSPAWDLRRGLEDVVAFYGQLALLGASD
jgi:UDP-glucose 4-epimerase